MYPILLVDWAGELPEGECLARSRVNTGAPECQTGASWAMVSGHRQARKRKGPWQIRLQRQSLHSFIEPPYADPHKRWCGEGARQRASLPDLPAASFDANATKQSELKPFPVTVDVIISDFG